ncbi:MAG: hypothetical protein LLG00_15145 [Planctomycetaceae bacterium]|nr:hypothetical protein [Planctomycetaceae bacterium]
MRHLRLALIVLVAASAQSSLAATRPIPQFSEVRQAVLRYFQARRDYRPGDLITRQTIAPLLGQLQQKGLPLPDSKQILESVPSDDGFLARQLATPAGRSFMRQVARYPDAYDRLDRLSRMPRGEQTVRDLIRGPDGYKMLQYMTTTPGGEEMGRMLSNAPGAGDFNAPTGRIYTVDALLAQLEKSHAASVKATRQPKRSTKRAS